MGNRRQRRSPPRPQPKELTVAEDAKPQLRYSDGDSSLSSSDPPSPPSVDEFVMPVPAPVEANRMKEEDFENDIEGEDDEGFTSFVASSTSSSASEGRKNEDQPACEPPARDDTPTSRTETAEKKPFKFTRSSIGAYSERSSVQPRESSMIDIDGLDEDDDEGLNMDFMSSVHVASNSSK
ncbi:Cleavage induced Hypothetical protein [Phytophthora palmivora]|uniref:Uncharacterized protein n=1 Tax=Phytophthora palmivora TaxID=4796 RepID=A0A2P4WVS6_9STRA|nr:Cleavage induced Hypothetical protein [Phytophthora palmivora]